MKKPLSILLLSFSVPFLFSQSNDCYKKMELAFETRGSYTIEDAIHNNVVISFFKPNGSYCYKGTARVENGTIVSISIFFEDNTKEELSQNFTNELKRAPVFTNGISELIITSNKEKLKVVFIDKLKPKTKIYKEADIPEDL